MRQAKSIEKLLISLTGFTIFALFFILSFRIHFSSESLKIVSVGLFLLNAFICLTLVNLKKIKFLLTFYVLTALSYSLLFLFFRNIRSFFPKPSLIEAKAIGFAAYYGYPLYFDIWLFFMLIFIPIVIFLMLKKLLNEK